MIDYKCRDMFPLDAREQIGDRFDKLDTAMIKKRLSQYGAVNAKEFRAELISGALAGNVYPEEFAKAAYLDRYTQNSGMKMLYDMTVGKIPNTSATEQKFANTMNVLFQQKGSQFQIDILANDKVQDFISSHAKVLDNGFKFVPMSDNMRQRLQRSNYIFSGIKTFHELNEAFPSLIDENGNRKPFEQFLNDVQKIDRTYNRNYLRAEYNFCHASATMAAKWEEFQQDGDRYNLQYRTAHDDRVRPEHAALDRVTLPITDPFWEEFYPPNGWNCRCTVVQVRKSKYPETPHDEAMALGEEATGKDTKGIFHFNPGIEQKTFPDYNPYTIRRCRDCDLAKRRVPDGSAVGNKLVFVPENELCAACRLIRAINQGQNKAEYNRLYNNPEYQDVQYNEASGGVKATHVEHNFDKTTGWYEKNAQTAGFNSGHSVILEKEPQDIYRHRSCEGLWDGLPFEVAGAETGTANNIRNALKHCAKKPGSKIAVIYFPNDNFSTEAFNDGLAKFNGLKGTSQYKLFDFIYCIHGESIIQIKKPSI